VQSPVFLQPIILKEMASSSNPRKRTKRAMVKNAGSDSDNNEPDYP